MAQEGIVETIIEVGDGQFDLDAGSKLTELISECTRAARQKNADASGSLTIKLGLKANASGVVAISATVSKTTPKIPAQPMIRFVGKSGQLLKAPENQTALPFGATARRNPMEDEGN